MLVWVVLDVRLSIETAASLGVCSDRILTQEPPGYRIIVALLHVHQLPLGILHMASEADLAGGGAGFGAGGWVAVGLEAGAVEHGAGGAGAGHRAAQGVGVHVLHPRGAVGLGDRLAARVDGAGRQSRGGRPCGYRVAV
jgi:hypothetical protein